MSGEPTAEPAAEPAAELEAEPSEPQPTPAPAPQTFEAIPHPLLVSVVGPDASEMYPRNQLLLITRLRNAPEYNGWRCGVLQWMSEWRDNIIMLSWVITKP